MKLILLSVLQSLLAALSQQILQSDVTLSITATGSQPMTYAGSLLMQGENFRAAMLGITAAYDGQTLYVYQPESDELTISTPSREDLQQTNPLIFVKSVVPLCTASERPAKNPSETLVTLTPANSGKSGNIASTNKNAGTFDAGALADVRSITIRVRNSDSMPLSVELRETKTTNLLTLTSPSWLSSLPSAYAAPFVLSSSDFPSAFINDLR